MKPLLDQIPAEIEVLEDEDGLVTIMPFAESNDQEEVVSLDCHAVPATYDGRFFYEFYFQITVTPIGANNQDIIYIQSSAAAKRYIPDLVKPLLIPTVCKCYEALAEATAYPWVLSSDVCKGGRWARDGETRENN